MRMLAAIPSLWHKNLANFENLFNKMLIRYREKNARTSNWIELPVNPPNARKIQIHNLSAGTTYEFQVIGMNEYGDGMYSQIVEARTKGKSKLDHRNDIIPNGPFKDPLSLSLTY